MVTVLVRIEPEKKMDRWYSVTVQPTLLDPCAVICAWGALCGSGGAMVIDGDFDTDNQA